MNLASPEKVRQYTDESFSVRVAYQFPVKVILDAAIGEVEIAANTFEDALVYENIDLFKTLDGDGLIKKFKEALNQHKTPADLANAMFSALKSGSKAEFSLELLFKEPNTFKVPTYIREGLEWLQSQICRKENESLPTEIKKDIPSFPSQKEVA